MRSLAVVPLIVLMLFTAYVSAIPSPTSTTPGDRTCEGKTKQIDVAIVIPSFTLTAYAPESYYAFFHAYGNLGPKSTMPKVITENLDWLETPVINQSDNSYSKLRTSKQVASWYSAQVLSMNFSYPVKTYILSDEDIHNGNIINPVQPKYNKCDMVILMHQEYVTNEEYATLKKYVHNGGRLLILEGNSFFAQVELENGMLSLKEGHGWLVTEQGATFGPREKYFVDNINWVGSVYLCNGCVKEWGDMPFPTYTGSEENYVINHTAKVIHDFEASTANGPVVTVAAYEKSSGNGKVVQLGINGSVLVLRNDPVYPEFFKMLVDTALRNKVV